MSAGATIDAALKAMGGTMGEMCMAMVQKQGVGATQIETWVRRLREAADKLEELVK